MKFKVAPAENIRLALLLYRTGKFHIRAAESEASMHQVCENRWPAIVTDQKRIMAWRHAAA